MRHLNTNKEMFDSLVDHLYKARKCSVSEAFVTIFRAQTPGTEDGPRVWNRQLLRYAGFKVDDDQVIGDPMEVPFTNMVLESFPEAAQKLRDN